MLPQKIFKRVVGAIVTAIPMPPFHGNVRLIYRNQDSVALEVRNDNFIEQFVSGAHVAIDAFDNNQHHINPAVNFVVDCIGLVKQVDDFF